MSKKAAKYRILTSTDGRTWKLFPAVAEGASVDAILGQFYDAREPVDGEHVVAVPARSFQPVTPVTTTRTTTKFAKVGASVVEREIEGAAV